MAIRIRTAKAAAAADATAYQFYLKNIVEPIKNYITNHRHAWYQWIASFAKDVATEVHPAVTEAQFLLKQFGAPIKEALEAEFADLARAAITKVTGNLEKHRDLKPSDFATVAGDAMADAFGFGLASFATSAAFEMLIPEKLNSLNGVGPMLATLAGFEEVTKNAIGATLRVGIGTPATYDAQSKFRPYLPGAAAALTLSARRKLLDADMNALLDFNGISPTYRAALNAGKYRPISPRALATLTLDQPFDRTQMQEILEDNSMSPDHVQFMLTQLEYNSTKNVRAQFIAEAERAYDKGVMGDREFAQILGDAGWSSAAIQLIKSKVLLQRRVTLGSEVEKQVIPLVANGNITPDQGLQQLEAAGVQDWYAQLVITLATTKAEIHAAKLEAAAERKLELSRQRNLTRAAVAEFQRGVIDEAGLAAALAAIGLDPTLVASVVAVQDATRTGRLRLIFGQLLLPEDAKVLSDRVAAIEGQFKKQLLTLDQARSQLQGLSVNGPELDALLARWAAALTAASKYAYLVDPLTGQKVP